MAIFQFRLQRYLNVKEQIEDQKEIEYASALRQVEEEKNRLNALETTRSQTIEALREAVSKTISPIIIKQFNNNIERLKHRIMLQKERLAAAEYMAEEKRYELVEAMKERKALEIVKDNAHEEYLKEEDVKQRKITDELISYKYALKKEGKSG